MLSLIGLCHIVADETATGKIGGRGFGDDYNWKSFDAGIKEAESSSKPAMVVIHKSW